MSTFHQTLKDIKSYIEDYMETFKEELEYEELIIGEKARNPQTPTLWFIFGRSIIDPDALSSTCELVRLTCSVVAMVEDRDVERGQDIAEQLSLKATRKFLLDTTMNGLVSDVIRTAFVPSGTRVADKRVVHAAGVELEIRFYTED